MSLHNMTCAKWRFAPGLREAVDCTCGGEGIGPTMIGIGTRVIQKGGGIRGMVVTQNLVDETITLDNPLYPGPYLAEYFIRDGAPLFTPQPPVRHGNVWAQTTEYGVHHYDDHGKHLGLCDCSSPTATVDHVPDWMTAHDLIVKRGRRKYALALNQTEPRYLSWRRKYPRLMRAAALIIALTITALWVVVCYKLRAFR